MSPDHSTPARQAVAVVLAAGLAPVVASSIGAWWFYVGGNGVTGGAIALGTVPVALLLVPGVIALPYWAALRFLLLGLLIGDAGFVAWRVLTVRPDVAYPVCVDGDCTVGAPWLSRLVREDETAWAGIELSQATGVVSPPEVATAWEAARVGYGQLDLLRRGRPGANGVFLWSSADRVYSVNHFPPGDEKVPAIVLLHGFGGLLTPNVSMLAETELGQRFAIVAPALDMTGGWWEDRGKDVLLRTLETLPPRVDRDRLWLAGISNGAIGATHLGADPELGARFRGTILIVGADLPYDGDRFGGPVLLLPGRDDPRFPFEFVLEAADAIGQSGAEYSFQPLEGDHFVPWTRSEEVAERILRWTTTAEALSTE
jgi:pimeloyl-ACP methyl ester carboxylesterase